MQMHISGDYLSYPLTFQMIRNSKAFEAGLSAFRKVHSPIMEMGMLPKQKARRRRSPSGFSFQMWRADQFKIYFVGLIGTPFSLIS
jgi:hypothetical protein